MMNGTKKDKKQVSQLREIEVPKPGWHSSLVSYSSPLPTPIVTLQNVLLIF